MSKMVTAAELERYAAATFFALAIAIDEKWTGVVPDKPSVGAIETAQKMVDTVLEGWS